MRKKLLPVLSFALGLTLISGAAYALFLGLRWFARIFLQLNPNVAAAIVAGSATVGVSVLTVLLSKWLEARANLVKEHRERKTPIYEDLLQFMFRFLMDDKLHSAPKEQESLKWFSSFTQKIMVWGSDEVLSAFVKFRHSAINPDPKADPIDGILNVERLILAIRKDLGHKNKGLHKGDILALFVNDIYEKLGRKG